MADSKGAPSWLAIVLLIVLIGIVIYFFTGEPDDNELEVDIGMAREVPVQLVNGWS